MSEPGLTGSLETRLIALYSWNQAFAICADRCSTAPAGCCWLEEMHWLVESDNGRPDNGSDASPFSNVELFAPLKNYDEWPAGMTKDKLTAQLQEEFDAALPGVVFNFSQYIQDNVEEALSGAKGANSVKVIGPNLTVLEQYAAELLHEMEQVKGKHFSNPVGGDERRHHGHCRHLIAP